VPSYLFLVIWSDHGCHSDERWSKLSVHALLQTVHKLLKYSRNSAKNLVEISFKNLVESAGRNCLAGFVDTLNQCRFLHQLRHYCVKVRHFFCAIEFCEFHRKMLV